MKEICLIRTRMREENLEKLVGILESRYRVVVRNNEIYRTHPFTDEELKNASVNQEYKYYFLFYIYKLFNFHSS